MTSCYGCCRSLRACQRYRGVVREPEAGISPAPPASRTRRRLGNAATVAAILILLVLPLAGPFLDKVR